VGNIKDAFVSFPSPFPSTSQSTLNFGLGLDTDSLWCRQRGVPCEASCWI